MNNTKTKVKEINISKQIQVYIRKITSEKSGIYIKVSGQACIYNFKFEGNKQIKYMNKKNGKRNK